MNYFIGIIFFYFLFFNIITTTSSKYEYELIPYFNIFNTSNLDKNSESHVKSTKKIKK